MWAYPGTAQIFWVPSIISGTGKATDFKLGQYIQRVHPNKSPLKFLEKRERGRIQGLPNFFRYPYYIWNGKSYGCQIWPVHSGGPSKQKPIKMFGEKGAWAYPGTAQFFRIPPIISGTGKATNFKFCVYIYRLNRNKSPLKILRKVAMSVVRDSRKFSRHQYIGRIARSSLRQLSFLVSSVIKMC